MKALRIWLLACLMPAAVTPGCGLGPAADFSRFQDDHATEPYVMSDIATLAETGLYVDFAAKIVAPTVRAYTPRFPLFSDGAEKSRFIALPAGAEIDAAAVELWKLPVGTKIWKEFRNGARRIETRYLEKRPEQWQFASFIWNEDATAAFRWTGNAIPNAATIAVPTPTGVEHVAFTVPSFDQCLTCHKQHGAGVVNRPDPILGFTAFQLPRADLEDLAAKGALPAPLGVDWDAHAIPAANERERSVIGYLAGNCGNCHNRLRPEFVPQIGGEAFSLDYNLASVHSRDDINLVKMIGRPVFNNVVKIPQVLNPTIITPGKSKESMLFFRMNGAAVPFAMPEIGVTSKDLPFIIGTLKPWINHLDD